MPGAWSNGGQSFTLCPRQHEGRQGSPAERRPGGPVEERRARIGRKRHQSSSRRLGSNEGEETKARISPPDRIDQHCPLLTGKRLIGCRLNLQVNRQTDVQAGGRRSGEKMRPPES